MLYLFAEIWIWMLVALLVGVLLGWALWGRFKGKFAVMQRDAETARRMLEEGRPERVETDGAAASGTAVLEARVARLDADLAAANAARAAAERELADARQAAARDRAPEPLPAVQQDVPASANVVAPTAPAPAVAVAPASVSPAISPATPAPSRPVAIGFASVAGGKLATFLEAPVGSPDDLLVIKGIGEKLNALLTSLGVFHYRQIAEWTEREVAQVDAQLGQFRGRIVRDRWIEQARMLADGRLDAFEAEFGRHQGQD